MMQVRNGLNADALLGLAVVVAAGALIWDQKTEHKVQPRTMWPSPPLHLFIFAIERFAQWKVNVQAVAHALGAKSLG